MVGYREHRHSGYIEATAHTESLAYARTYAARNGRCVPKLSTWCAVYGPACLGARGDYTASRAWVVSAARRWPPLDSAIARTTTKNPMADRTPAIGALCVSRRRCAYACHASAAVESRAPATALGSAMPVAARLIGRRSALDVETSTLAAPI